jgi:hypothetical protein
LFNHQSIAQRSSSRPSYPSHVNGRLSQMPRTPLIWLRKLCTGEAQKLKQAANQLQSELAEQRRKAEEAREQLAPIRSYLQRIYHTHTRNGIEGHFQFALRTLALPLPSNFPWSTFLRSKCVLAGTRSDSWCLVERSGLGVRCR